MEVLIFHSLLTNPVFRLALVSLSAPVSRFSFLCSFSSFPLSLLSFLSLLSLLSCFLLYLPSHPSSIRCSSLPSALLLCLSSCSPLLTLSPSPMSMSMSMFRAVDLDIFVGNRENMANELWVNDGIGTFTAASGALVDDSERADAAVFADVDGDGDLDLILGSWNYKKELWLNVDGSGSFTAVGSSPFGANKFVTSLAVGDIDGDGGQPSHPPSPLRVSPPRSFSQCPVRACSASLTDSP